jgi:hypothetical protein
MDLGRWVTSFIYGIFMVLLLLFVIGTFFRILDGEVP